MVDYHVQLQSWCAFIVGHVEHVVRYKTWCKTNNYTLRPRKLKGVYWFHRVRLSVYPCVHLSVCGQNRVRSVSSTILAGSISYLNTLSEGVSRVMLFFKILKIWSFDKFFKFVNLTLSCFDLGSNINCSIVWAIRRRPGYPQNAGVLVVLVSLFLSIFFSVQLVINFLYQTKANGCP